MNSVDMIYILELAVFIGMADVGIVQLIKNFTKSKRGKVTTFASLIVTIVLCILNTNLVSPTVTVLADLIAISISISQLAWDILAQAVPNAVGHFIDKIVATKSPAKGKKAEAKNAQ